MIKVTVDILFSSSPNQLMSCKNKNVDFRGPRFTGEYTNDGKRLMAKETYSERTGYCNGIAIVVEGESRSSQSFDMDTSEWASLALEKAIESCPRFEAKGTTTKEAK